MNNRANLMGNPPLGIAKKIAKTHSVNVPDLGMLVCIWRNPSEDNWQPWKRGVELVEICENVSIPDLEFRPTQFGASGKWPPLSVILTSPDELKLDQEKRKGASFVSRLKRGLENGRAKIVFKKSTVSGSSSEVLDKILGPGA